MCSKSNFLKFSQVRLLQKPIIAYLQHCNFIFIVCFIVVRFIYDTVAACHQQSFHLHSLFYFFTRFVLPISMNNNFIIIPLSFYFLPSLFLSFTRYWLLIGNNCAGLRVKPFVLGSDNFV